MDDDGKPASGLPVENREQPLVGIPLNGPFRGNPFRAALPARAGRAARDIKDHGIGWRTEAADRRPLRRLRLPKTGSDKGYQPAENDSPY